MRSAYHQLGLLYGGPILAYFLKWLRTSADADRIDFVLFLIPAGSALDLSLSGADSAGFPRYAFLSESRLWFDLASVNESRIAQEISDLDDEEFRGLAPWQALARMGVPPPSQRMMSDIGLGDHTCVTEATQPQFRAFLQAYKWEIFKACRENRRSLFQRLVRFGLDPGMRVAIVDASGDLSRQAAFERALRRLFPAWVAGYHFCLLPDPAMDVANPQAVRSFVAAESVPPDGRDVFFRARAAEEPVEMRQFAAGIQEFQRQFSDSGSGHADPDDDGLSELFASLRRFLNSMPA